ncbi:MAG: cytochrome bc complex cytochrome b subunit [Candidatus Aminicenantes bacterium RBG_16_63_16]|nr:MAG: cytochrome bc complex cytochrome b subunit [Candidatus Aminicenantes bacterium RBG_16_63_16]
MSGFWHSVRSYLDSRFKLEAMLAFGRKKMVPEHEHSFWYYLGGLCLFLFIIQVITGLLLLLYYNPTVDGAHESIRFIMSQVRFGWLIRSIHSWTANILIGAIFVHMFSAYFLKAYRPPRELTWMSGFFLLVLFMAFGFSGYLLPWNELSFFATRVGTDIAGSIPLIGKAVKTFILGGATVTEATIGRFFWLHIGVLPAAALLVIGVHVLLVQTLGMSRPMGLKTDREISFFPQFILKDALGWLLVLGGIGVICVFIPWEVGTKADPFAATPLGIKPEWYFTFMFTTLKIVPSHVLSIEGEVLAILGFMLGGLLWLLVPFLDRRALREKASPAFTAAGALIVIYIVVMTALTYLAPNLGK